MRHCCRHRTKCSRVQQMSRQTEKQNSSWNTWQTAFQGKQSGGIWDWNNFVDGVLISARHLGERVPQGQREFRIGPHFEGVWGFPRKHGRSGAFVLRPPFLKKVKVTSPKKSCLGYPQIPVLGCQET